MHRHPTGHGPKPPAAAKAQDRPLPPRASIRFYDARRQAARLRTGPRSKLRSCANNGRIRFFTSRSDDAHNSRVVSIDAPIIHDLRNHGDLSDSEIKQMCQQKITTVMVGSVYQFLKCPQRLDHTSGHCRRYPEKSCAASLRYSAQSAGQPPCKFSNFLLNVLVSISASFTVFFLLKLSRAMLRLVRPEDVQAAS